VAGGLIGGAGLENKYRGTAYKFDEEAFKDPTAEANKKKLEQRAGEAAARTAERVAASSVADPGAVRAADIGAVDQGTAAVVRGVAGPTAARVGTVQQGQAGQTRQVGVGPAARIETDPQAQFRGGQATAMDLLRARAEGGGPSPAALLLREQTDRNIAGAVGRAASAGPGVNPATAARLAGQQIATTNQQAGRDAALLRAEETARATEQLATTAGAGRQQDIGLAAEQARLEQETTTLQSEADLQRSLADMQAQQQIALQSGDIELARNIEQARLAQQTALAAGEIDLARALEDSRNEQQIAVQRGELDLARNIEQARLQTETAIKSGDMALARNIANAQLEQGAAAANQQAALQQQQLNDQLVSQYVSQGLALDQAQFLAGIELERLRGEQSLGIQGINAGVAAGNQATKAGVVGGMLGAGGAIGAGYAASDKRLKKDIAPGDKDIRAVMERLKPYAFSYKNPDGHGATHGQLVGVMAQDLQKSSKGRDMVLDTPDGLMVDSVKAVSAALAASADLHRRVSKLEHR